MTDGWMGWQKVRQRQIEGIPLGVMRWLVGKGWCMNSWFRKHSGTHSGFTHTHTHTHTHTYTHTSLCKWRLAEWNCKAEEASNAISWVLSPGQGRQQKKKKEKIKNDKGKDKGKGYIWKGTSERGEEGDGEEKWKAGKRRSWSENCVYTFYGLFLFPLLHSFWLFIVPRRRFYVCGTLTHTHTYINTPTHLSHTLSDSPHPALLTQYPYLTGNGTQKSMLHCTGCFFFWPKSKMKLPIAPLPPSAHQLLATSQGYSVFANLHLPEIPTTYETSTCFSLSFPPIAEAYCFGTERNRELDNTKYIIL